MKLNLILQFIVFVSLPLVSFPQEAIDHLILHKEYK